MQNSFERLTQPGFDMCAYCAVNAECQHFRDHTFPVCGSKAVYDRLATYEDIGLMPEQIIELRKRKHGLTHTRLYTIWSSMRQRCNSPQYKSFKDYGGRGIKICEEWDDFQSFYDWAMANGYADDLSIDRIDNDGNYEPSNCQWIALKDQQGNRRCAKLTLNNETHTIEEWAEILGVSNSCIRERLKRNLPMEDVLAPKKKV